MIRVMEIFDCYQTAFMSCFMVQSEFLQPNLFVMKEGTQKTRIIRNEKEKLRCNAGAW